jgi:hypothetical protein
MKSGSNKPQIYDFIDGRLAEPGGKYGQWKMGGITLYGPGRAALGATNLMVQEALITAEGGN